MNGELYRLPIRSGNVTAPSFWPSRRVGRPKTANAIRMPRPMFSTVSQIRPMPRLAATPPKPMIAEVEMKVAPYERAMTSGCRFRPASR